MVLKEFRYLLVAKEFILPHRLYTVQNLPQQHEGGRDISEGEKTLSSAHCHPPGRPLLFVKFESFLALKTGDQAGNPLPDGSVGRCRITATLGSLPAAAG